MNTQCDLDTTSEEEYANVRAHREQDEPHSLRRQEVIHVLAQVLVQP